MNSDTVEGGSRAGAEPDELRTDSANPTALAILDAAQAMMQTVGYNGLSFRDIAAAVGIKSASVHYHYPTKGALGAAVVRRYTDVLLAQFAALADRGVSPRAAIGAYVAAMKQTLERDGRMCLAGILAAEIAAVPPEVRAEVSRFVDLNVAWLADVIGGLTGNDAAGAPTRDHAIAIFAGLEGAMMIARAADDLSRFDAIVATMRRTGLLPS